MVVYYNHKESDAMNPIPISERPRIEEFTIKVFNLYNGRINVFNKPAKLNIEWALRYNSNNGGSARNPSNITIYPEVIRRAVADEYHFWYNLIVCVIHELFHVDQVICYPKLMYDEAYKNIIESAVEMETYLFIANHQYEIAQSIGFDDRIRYDQYYDAIKDKFETGRLYQRRDYHSHMISVLQDMLFTEKGINWNDLPTTLKRGSCCVKDIDGKWIIDNEIPIFRGEDRNYIENRIKFE